MSKRSRYYILDGQTVVKCSEMLKWAAFFEDKDACRVGLTMVNKVRISTVFLGLDHQWGKGPPLIFETMIFGGDHDGYQERYTTWAEAEKGHERAILIATAIHTN